MDWRLILQIKNIIVKKAYFICHFKDKAHLKEAPAHFYIIIPTQDDNFMLLCMITSKVEKKIRYYTLTNKKALQSLVYLDKKDLQFLSLDCSVMDCNQSEYIENMELVRRIDEEIGFKIIIEPDKFQEGLKEKIKQAIIVSPLIKPFIKKKLL